MLSTDVLTRFTSDVDFAREIMSDATRDPTTMSLMTEVPEHGEGVTLLLSQTRRGSVLPFAVAVGLVEPGRVRCSVVLAERLIVAHTHFEDASLDQALPTVCLIAADVARSNARDL